MKPVFWTTEEMVSLKNGLLPSTKSKKAAMAKLNGLNRPCRKLFHEHFEYEGTNWSWKKGSWICTNTKVRNTGKYNLCKVLWEKFHGFYPDANHDVRFKDGNKYNLNKSNLVLLTKREAQLLRLKDPHVKANTYATGCLGFLMNTIAELQDPSKRKERCRKAAETTRQRHPDRGRKAWETRRKRCEEKGFFYTEEQRKKMSESHKRKPNPMKGKNMSNREDIKVASEWWSTGGKVIITEEQKKRKKKTGSLYRRDEQVAQYEVHKGRFV